MRTVTSLHHSTYYNKDYVTTWIQKEVLGGNTVKIVCLCDGGSSLKL